MNFNKRKKPIVLHIGLSKTGTTFLQTQIFPKIPGIYYLGTPEGRVRRTNRGTRFVLRNLRKLLSSDATALIKVTTVIVSAITRGRVFLISHELLSMGGTLPVWTPRGKSIDSFIKGLLGLMSLIPGREIKIIIAFRDSAEWVASRYAESSRLLGTPGQADFEKRVLAILADEAAYPAFGWLHRSRALDALRGTVGSENVFSYQLEDFASKPDQVIQMILAFMGISSGIDSERLEDSYPERKNVHRDDLGGWRLEGTKERLVLSENLAERIRVHFSDDRV